MSRSKFSNYRKGVKFILMTRHEWDEEGANTWIEWNKQLLWEAWTNKIPRSEMALIIVKETSSASV